MNALTAADAAKLRWDRLERRLERCCAIAETVRARASGAVRASGVSGMDEAKLHTEWRNLVAGMSARDAAAVAGDPEGSYLGWIARRIADPYALCGISFSRLRAKYGDEFANDMRHVVWPVEIAWAQRLRRSQADRIAMLSRLFLTRAAADPIAESLAVAGVWAIAMGDPAFYKAPERRYQPSEIRDGYGSNEFVPAFLRFMQASQAVKMQKTDPDRIRLMAMAARAEEERDLAVIARRRAVVAARRSPLSRSVAAMTVAVERGMTSDQLVRAEALFLDDLEKGLVDVSSTTRYPQAEFIDFLRTRTDFEGADPAPALSNQTLEINDRIWIAALPVDLKRFGSDDDRHLHPWLDRILKAKDHPLDLVVDYGMELVRHASTPATFQGRRRRPAPVATEGVEA